VLVFEDPTSEDSRYYYTWLRHGVQGAIDGSDRASIERWLADYMAKPVLVDTETSTLSDRLVAVPGFAYVNFADPYSTKQLVTKPLGKIPSSLHQIVDEDGAIGGLILAEAPSGVATLDYVDGLLEAGLKGFTDAGPVTFGTTTAEHLTGTSGQEAFVWVDNGIAAAMLTKSPTETTAFLNLFAAPPS
jgi:hypothetical protein